MIVDRGLRSSGLSPANPLADVTSQYTHRLGARVSHIRIALAALLPLIGCTDLSQPTDERMTARQGDRYGLTSSFWMGDTIPCPAVASCAIKALSEGEACVCELEGIGANVRGGPGNPGPYPDWADPPGFPDSDPGDWPEPPGGGSWPNLPDPEPWECDPHGITNSCFFTAELRCSTNVTRGTYGECKLDVDPSSALDAVIVWTFNGVPNNNIYASYNADTTTWGGTLIYSGEVRVEFYALGRYEMIASSI